MTEGEVGNITATVLCIGGAVIDRVLETVDPPKTATSNPVRSRLTHGGVARNVAENLARLGCHAALASLIGEDAAGAELTTGIEAAGIDGRWLHSVPGARTAEYTAVFHRGELFAAFADMAIFDGWDTVTIDELAPIMASISWVFTDCNPPPRVLQRLREMRRSLPFHLAVDAVSVAKSARLGDDLSQVDVLFLNRDEARAMTGSREPRQAMLKLKERGAGRVVLTDGAAGVHALEGGSPLWFPAPAVEVMNASGAGDALVGGTLLRLTENAPLADAIEFGISCAALALSSPETVAPRLSRDEVERSILPRSGTDA